MGEYRPCDARMFGGEGDGGRVHVSAVPQPPRPGALGIRFRVDDAQCYSCAMDQGPQVPIALARDPSEPLFTAARALLGRDAERGGITAPIFLACGSPMLATSAVAVCGPIAKLRRHEPHRVPELGQLTAPIVRAAARLDPYQVRRYLHKELQYLRPRQLITHRDFAASLTPCTWNTCFAISNPTRVIFITAPPAP